MVYFLPFALNIYKLYICLCTLQMIQVLSKHKGYIVNVKWAKQTFHHDIGSPYCLRLAAADYNGRIIVYDVKQATILADFSDNSRPIAGTKHLYQPYKT